MYNLCPPYNIRKETEKQMTQSREKAINTHTQIKIIQIDKEFKEAIIF